MRKNTTSICIFCNKEFDNNYVPTKKYCTRQCMKDHAKFLRPKKNCRNCGKEFSVTNYMIDKQFYCSKECRLAYGWTQPDPSKHKIFTCKWCGKEFETYAYRNPDYCSAQCTAEYASSKRIRTRNPENYVIRTCQECGKNFEIQKWYIENTEKNYGTFCSIPCRSKARSKSIMGDKNHNYRGGRIVYRGINWKEQAKLARERDFYTCQKCGTSPANSVHHLIPFRDFGEDYISANKLDNLVTLCISCHMKIEAEYYKSKSPSSSTT